MQDKCVVASPQYRRGKCRKPNDGWPLALPLATASDPAGPVAVLLQVNIKGWLDND